MAVSTDPQKIAALLSRGVEHVYPKADFLQSRLESGEQLTLYTGYDPTGPTLHIGHGITLLKLREFQDLGHKVIMLIGDFTGMIGDPTDKTSARQKLTREEVLINCAEYQKQAAAILDFDGDNPVEVKYNSEWLAKMSFGDVVELASNFTVQQMLVRDMFQERMKEEKPIYLHEFLYPLMQGIDSVKMVEGGVDGEIGGNDQTFNMLAGRTLEKALLNKEKFVVTGKLLADDSGKKMGKTEGNMISFNDSAEDMFGKVMRWTDTMILSGFELCTRIPIAEIDEIKEQMDNGTNPRDFKLRLAEEITKTFLGAEAAEQGKTHFAQVIQGKDKPVEMEELDLAGKDIVTVLKEAGFAGSSSDARRAIESGGVRINDEKIDSHEAVVASGDIVQKGKRFFVKIV